MCQTGYNFERWDREEPLKGGMMSIRFGTDGWRAVISETFTFANLRREHPGEGWKCPEVSQRRVQVSKDALELPVITE